MRPHAQVMLDLARIQEEVGTDRTFVAEDEWGELIAELAELPDTAYHAALETHRTVTKIADVSVRLLRK